MIGKAFFALVFGITLFLPHVSYAASLSVSPKSGTYTVGQSVTYTLMVVGDQPLNAVGAKVLFPTEFFTLEGVSKNGSILTFWVTEPTATKSSGVVQFEGVSLTGFPGGTGTLVTVTLRARKAGSGSVSFQSGQVLANDGQGTDITQGMSGAAFTIVAAPSETQVPPVSEQKTVPFSPIVDVLRDHGHALVKEIRIAPEIRLGEMNQEAAIYGFSPYPQAKVLLTFIPRSGQRLFITGDTDVQGNFVLLVPTSLRGGPYAVSAVVVLTDGTQTESSDPLVVEIGQSGTGELGVYVGPIYASLGVLFILVTLMFSLLWLRLGPMQKSQQKVVDELTEAEDVVHQSFRLLREDIARHNGRDQLRASGAAAEGDSLEESLDQAELLIEKEIQDIGIAALNKKDPS